MQLIDSHCHLNYDYLPKSCSDLVREAHESGVVSLVTIGTDIPSIEVVQKISDEYENVYHTVGIHPHDTSSLVEGDLKLLEKAAFHPKCRAIGEIGLDYHYENSPKGIQIEQLEQQLDLALRVNQPVVIHSRDAEEELFISLKRYSAKKLDNPGVIHCFSGTVEFGKKCLDLGFYISFSGILTFKKADEVREAAKLFPLDRMLVETDAPFLAPIPFRGKKCEPSMVKYTALKLAEIKGISIDKVSSVTTENSKRLFRI